MSMPPWPNRSRPANTRMSVRTVRRKTVLTVDFILNILPPSTSLARFYSVSADVYSVDRCRDSDRSVLKKGIHSKRLRYSIEKQPDETSVAVYQLGPTLASTA